jgi:hypothetical protein
MAITSSQSSVFTPPNITQLIGTRMDGTNYPTWRFQCYPILQTYDLLGFVEGTEPCPAKFLPDSNGQVSTDLNPAYVLWRKKDQFVMSWLNASLTDKVISTLYGLTTSRQVWLSLSNRYASQSRSRILNLKRQLQNLQQGSKTCTEYLHDAKLLADQLAAVGKPVDEDDLISYIIGGLNASFNAFITTCSFTLDDSTMSFDDFQSKLLSHEMFLEQQNQALHSSQHSFAMVAQKSKSLGPRKSKFNFTPRPTHNLSAQPHFAPRKSKFTMPSHASPPQHKYAPSTNLNSAPRSPCQICGKLSHRALDCFHRMDYSFQGRHPPAQLAAMVAPTHTVPEDDPWYADSGANNHITNDIANLSLHEPYGGDESVAVGNGSGLSIKNTGSLHLHTPSSSFHLNRVFHCPTAMANLLSINQFCLDNDCFFILTGSHYFVKDNKTGKTLLEGRSEGGLYPIHINKNFVNKCRAHVALFGVKTSLDVWHARLGHPSSQITKRVVSSFQLPLAGSLSVDHICSHCQLGKSKQLPFSDSTRVSSHPLELIHSDVWVSPIVSHSGYRYYVFFIDDYSRFTWMYPISNKSDVFSCFVKFKTLVENFFSCRIKQFQSDNGGEYVSNQFTSFLTSNGILHRLTCPYTSQQNGVAERKHRHVMDIGLSLLAQSRLPSSFWVDAFLTAIFLINRLPTPILNHESPYSKLFQRSPDYSQLRSFGCVCYPLLRPYSSHKLAFRSKICLFLGYSSHHKGYRCYDPVSKKIYMSRNVVFDEKKFPGLLASQNSTPFGSTPSAPLSSPQNSVLSLPATSVTPPHQNSALSLPPTTNNQVNSLSNASVEFPPAIPINSALSLPPTTHNEVNPLNHASIDPSPAISIPFINFSPDSRSPSITHISPSSSPFSINPNSLPVSTLNDQPSPIPPISSPLPQNRMVTRTQTGSLKPKAFPDFKLFYSSKHPLRALHSVVLPPEPTCYSQAITSTEWRQAMGHEFDALLANKTWTLVPRPSNQNIIRNKWVYKLKQRADGSIDRYKARLVAKGFDQVCGVDFSETFSPVIKPATVRVILALAVHFGWPLRQLDVSNAFLHGNLLEEVYMEQPRGFVDPLFPDHVCRLHKALYGLKQAPRAWFNRLSQSLLELEFTASSVDNSLFTFHKSGIHIFLLVYVDDIVLTGTHSSLLDALIRRLQDEFALKDLGPLGYFLGIEVQRTPCGLHLRQSKYILDILHRARMIGAKPYAAPCVSGGKLSSQSGAPLSDVSEYRSIVGALQYCTLTRPEIAYSVNQLCQHLHAPTTAHWTSAKRVLRYLKGTVDHGLYFTRGSLALHAYSDSDWAGDPDDRRSTTGYGVFLGPCLISWCAKKQPTVSRSSTEAEYRALAMTVAELYWLRMLVKDLQLPILSPPIIWCDNIGALALASNPVYHGRTKHIEVDVHFIREKVANKDVILKFISTVDQVADIFTKGLSSTRFNFLKDKLMVCVPPISLRGPVNQPAVKDQSSAHDSMALSQEDTITASHHAPRRKET